MALLLWFVGDFRCSVLLIIVVLENKSRVPSIFKVQTVFTPISRLDKHTELLIIYFQLLVKKLNFSTSVAKSDLRVKFH